MRARLLCFLVAALCLWQALSSQQLLSALLLPAPVEILHAWRTRLLLDVVSTVGRAVVGTLLGTALAYLLHASALRLGFEQLLDRQVGLSRALPVVALLPIFIVWFGFSEFARTLVVSLAALGMALPVVHESIARVPRGWQLLYARGRLNFWRHYLQVLLPWSLIEVGSALRVLFAVALSVSLATEYMGAECGVGKFLDSARSTFNMPALWLGALVIGVVGMLIDRALVLGKQRLLFWGSTH